ncbi:DUF5317 domain-containing protein [Paratissierella segnis]|jgi:hypothetical protein|uniref:DUF5317 domain-containing protein n=1 Tax=Paratissierella segnis TaxID=2763679 RepID=A0A926EQI8_9FIRM|nr:DUF5317 domain-containing protein [Paratissierella segnis]MBC8587883.1 DUF5317 domain-containing protein [Paratissierella segnis]
MFIEPAIISILLVILRKGSLKKLKDVNIKGWYILFISAGVQVLISLSVKYNILEDFVFKNFKYLIILSYLFMIITILLNIEKKYMKLFLIGILLNLIVITANNGKMPVSINGFKGIRDETILPYREFDIKHMGINKNTKFKYLADIILIPKPYPLPKIISIGDIFLMSGIFMFFQEETFNKENEYPKFQRS